MAIHAAHITSSELLEATRTTDTLVPRFNTQLFPSITTCPLHLLRLLATDTTDTREVRGCVPHPTTDADTEPWDACDDTVTAMSELQRAWARAKVSGLPGDVTMPLDEAPELQQPQYDDEGQDELPELPEHQDDDSSSASSVSSTGTIIPSPNQKLFARPQG